MKYMKKRIAALLAVILLVNTIPLPVWAEEGTQPPTLTNEATGSEITSDSTVVPENGLQTEDTEAAKPENAENAENAENEQDIVDNVNGGEGTPEAGTGESTPDAGTGESTPDAGTGEDTPDTGTGEATPDAGTGEGTPEAGSADSAGAAFAEHFKLTLAENGYTQEQIGNIITVGTTAVTLLINDGNSQILELLSAQTQTAEANYQNWNLEFVITGGLTLSESFAGLGDTDYPFSGKFTQQSITITTKRTLFKELSSKAELNGVQISWKGEADIPILTKRLVTDSDAATINMPLSGAAHFSPYIGEVILTPSADASGVIVLPSLNYSAAQESQKKYADDLGLVCGKMGAGTKLQMSSLRLPEGESYFEGDKNVGTLIGSMEKGAELTVPDENLTLYTGLAGKNVGGLVGSMNEATILAAENSSIILNTTLIADENAGGIAGVRTVTGEAAPNTCKVLIQAVDAKGKFNTSNAGVLYGTCKVGNAENSGETVWFEPFAGISYAENPVCKVSGPGNCGGVFGTLSLAGNGSCRITDTEGAAKIRASLAEAANTTAYGGVAGYLVGKGNRNALQLQRCQVTSSINVGVDMANYPAYLGGIAAKQEKATLDVSHVSTDIADPKTKKAGDYGFGGITAYLGAGALLLAKNITVITNNYTTNPGGGGVVGSAHQGSVVWLQEKIDLSQCQLYTNDTTGQIVGHQDCSLIYAPDASISRLSYGSFQGMELDDIGNYGELYRIADFLTIGDDYAISFPNLSMTEGAYVLSSPLDYACLALAWQSRGYFPTVEGIDNKNWSTTNLKSSKIRLDADIVLTGCGIGGLTRDVDSAVDTFTGTFDGQGHTLTLDIGAQNQANSVTLGDGRIYRHNATGLFAVLSNSAKVQNLTLAGSIRISNKAANMRAGGLAATLSCGGNQEQDTSLLDSVSTQVACDIIAAGGTVFYVGGIFGYVSGSKATKIVLNEGTSLSSLMEITISGNGCYNHFGGFIGAIDNAANVNLVCNGATLGGSIQVTKAENCYAGGFIGTIMPGGSGKRTITFTDLTVRGFSFESNATTRMGGILGGIWANTDVTIKKLTVAGSTLTASGNAELGGLVYRGEGKWTVSSIDLIGLTVSAENAGALGLLVCHGEPYKEQINSTSYSNVNGLYLEMAEYWDWRDWNDTNTTGYRVPEIITYGDNVFDEFVAYTAYADRNSNTPSYDITHNGSGIISLKTGNGTVNMAEGEARNTYVNRTSVGQAKQTNRYSRYYYNLSDVKGSCNGGAIDTAKKLLIWSVYQYAASNLKDDFEIENVTDNTIGGTSKTRASFDMTGLSYYPVSVNNSDLILQYADVRFYNAEIEDKEEGNKLTRGTAANHTQHYMMHCGLFLNYTADTSKAGNYTMTVNGVSFAGTTGVVNGGSGALICGLVQGESQSGTSSTCKVILAAADRADLAIVLGGLSIQPEVDYMPVLINRIGAYAGLKANYVTASKSDGQTMQAGSSLIGDVGGQGANGISIEFAGTIKLPETGVFKKALLLNSLRYETGSATYRFYKSQDYNNETYLHNTTHGRELSTSVEYAGKQGCYYDGYGPGHYVSTSKNFDSQNDFTAYLPYVAYSPATKDEKGVSTHPLANNWHEVAVNVLSTDLKEGCGTYGHPYPVDANLLKEVANYINTGTASIGWQVRVPNNRTYHSANDECDVLLTYTDKGWMNGENKYEDDVQPHLASAYYSIEDDIELSDFAGIGMDGSDKSLPFTGVIVGRKEDGSIPTVTLSGGTTAFIKYSYGCVVRDLKIVMKQTLTLTRGEWTRGNPEQAPKTFYGGVIGCVLGGDNIIENVTVKAVKSSETTTDGFSYTCTGTNPHLIPVGGYVGVIAGGGVIFRGEYKGVSTGITGTDAALYQNPIIGRVLGGFAFYEGTGTAPDNGDKNYKINQLTPLDSKDLNWDRSTLIVNTAQGLLVLSAIISSGAGSSSSNAYAKGRARNAAYDHIGEETEPEDYETAKKDAGAVWSNGNTPYLLQKYAGYTGNASICSNETTGIDLKFAKDATFNMGNYGNGYRGLSARYVSNAAFIQNTVDASLVVLRIKSFDGQNATVQNIHMDVKEYADDDFFAASVGGIFNIVWTKKQSGGGEDGSRFAQNLTLSDCNVSLKYVKNSGDELNEASIDCFSNEDGRRAVSVGGFIGMANDVEAAQGSINHNYLISNIRIKGNDEKNKCKIYGPNAVGGLIGATAMASTGVTGYPGKLLANGKWVLFGPNFLNCSYSNIDVSGGLAAGGLVGDAYVNSTGTIPNFSGLGLAYNNGSFKSYTSCTVTDGTLIVGQNATITARAKASIAGGLFGGAGMRVGVNDPEVKTKSGITVLKGSDTIKSLCLSNVEVLASTTNFNADGSNPDNGANNAYVAGIIGRIGNVNPSCFYDIIINGGSAKTNASNSRVGGIQGSGYTNSEITMERCEISSFTLSGANTGGFLGNGQDPSGFKLNMSDCKLTDSTIYGTSTAGGLVGDAKSSYYLHNILIKNTSITAKTANAGRLFGKISFGSAGNDFKVYGAGISVYADKEGISIPEKDCNIDAGKSYIGYIAYADYAGTETKVDGYQDPYVTVNPNYRLTQDKLLTGDAVGKIAGDTRLSVAARIWADHNGAADRKNRVTYPKAAGIVEEPVVSTFNTEQGCGPDDLPVLVISDSDAGVIEDYLNVITNGGYSEAKAASAVKTTVAYYEYKYENGEHAFSALTAEDLNQEPAAVYQRSDGTLRINSSSYDNTRSRFNLVEASFTVKINGKDRTYTVSVPVIVKRELQYNSITTLTYGAEFDATVYSNLKTHVLESAGNPITAYLTLQYNRNCEKYVEYDWQGYLEGGGNMFGIDKKLSFSSGLPAGTKLLLVDCQNGNRAYSYEVNESFAGTAEILLSSFRDVADAGVPFRASMADILGVQAVKSAEGNFVATDASHATLRRNGIYYRPIKDGETVAEGTQRYTLTVPDLSQPEHLPEENYFLVITVPKQENEDFYLNGTLSVGLEWSMRHSGTRIHRYDGTTEGVGSNDESTYQISEGYQQTMTVLTESKTVDMAGNANQMQIRVKDEITFSNNQAYGDTDHLFFELTTDLQEHILDKDNADSVRKLAFPSGTSGQVAFFIQDSDGNYYVKTDIGWARTAHELAAASYLWNAQGTDMRLLLSMDGEQALDLSGVRKMIKGDKEDGRSSIIITTVMTEIVFTGQSAVNDTIPDSENSGTDTWAQMNFTARISVLESNLSYSSASAGKQDNTRYYRGVQNAAELALYARNISQLGINPLELMPEYLSDDQSGSRIDLIATLDFTKLASEERIKELLKNTNRITFKLSLKQGGRAAYEEELGNLQKYISFDTGAAWTIDRAQYYDEATDSLLLGERFDGTRFLLPITAYVNLTNREFANYRISLRADFEINESGSGISVTDTDAYVIYTYACIKPDFYE